MMQEQDQLRNNAPEQEWKRKRGYGSTFLLAVVAICGLVAVVTNGNSRRSTITSPVDGSLIRSGGGVTGTGGGRLGNGAFYFVGLKDHMKDYGKLVEKGKPCYGQLVACEADSTCLNGQLAECGQCPPVMAEGPTDCAHKCVKKSTETNAGKALATCLYSN